MSVQEYFDYFAEINIFPRLERMLKDLNAPGADITLCEMKAEESSLKSIVKEIKSTNKQLEALLRSMDFGGYLSDIIEHNNLVIKYLNNVEDEVADLLQTMRTYEVDDFEIARDNILSGLAKRAAETDEATNALAVKGGLLLSRQK